jgi:hypothetical protein
MLFEKALFASKVDSGRCRFGGGASGENVVCTSPEEEEPNRDIAVRSIVLGAPVREALSMDFRGRELEDCRVEENLEEEDEEEPDDDEEEELDDDEEDGIDGAPRR